MNITNIIILIYFIIGLICNCIVMILTTKLDKEIPFGFLGIIYFGNLLLWPIYFPKTLIEIHKINKK